MIDGITPKRIVGMVMILGMLVGSVGGATYYVDPVQGDMANDGSVERPWGRMSLDRRT